MPFSECLNMLLLDEKSRLSLVYMYPVYLNIDKNVTVYIQRNPTITLFTHEKRFTLRKYTFIICKRYETIFSMERFNYLYYLSVFSRLSGIKVEMKSQLDE